MVYQLVFLKKANQKSALTQIFSSKQQKKLSIKPNNQRILYSLIFLIKSISNLFSRANEWVRLRSNLQSVVILSLVLFCITSVNAQQSAHSAGGDGSSSTGSVAFSIGQVVYFTSSSTTGTVGKGVQQRYELVKVKSVIPLAQVQTNWSIDPILPAKVNVLLSEGQTVQVGVTWNKSTLNVFARGTYTLQGALIIPNFIDNTAQVRAQIKVQVLPKTPPVDVTLNNDNFEADKNKFFITIGDFAVKDPVDNVHQVSLFGDGYDNKFFEIKSNILFWNSADPAAGKDSFTIIVRVTDRDGNTLDKFFEIKRIRPDFNELVVNNAFTPNGDGANETWGVPDLRVFQGVRISVYDNVGSRLFYTESPDEGWDGTFNGKQLPVGSYFWTIEIKETGEMRKGMLNLIRK
jgi:gliding motility-associated-like protein